MTGRRARSAAGVGSQALLDERLEDEIYRALCLLLSERSEQVDWAAFSPPDWEQFLRTARTEGVAPLAHWHFKQAAWPDAVPEMVRERLAECYRRTAVRNMVRFRELEHLLTALAEADIPVVVLKGAALALTVYPDIALRPMGDIDLLLRAGDIDRAVWLSRSLGYRERDTRPRTMKAVLGAFHHWPLYHRQHEGVVVELHWSLVAGRNDWRAAQVGWFWERAEPLILPGGRALGAHLQTSAQCLYSAAHMALQHGSWRAPLLWYYDLYLMLHQSTPPWELLLEGARDLGWGAAASVALGGMSSRFGTSIPDLFHRDLAKASDERLTRHVRNKSQPPATRTVEVLGTALVPLSWKARVVYAWSYLVPRPASMRDRYAPTPAWLWPLCYPYRWLAIAWDSVRSLRWLVQHRGARSRVQTELPARQRGPF